MKQRVDTKISVVLFVAQALAFWPVWMWFASRVAGSTEAAWGVLPLASVAFFFWRRRVSTNNREISLGLPIALTLLYAATYSFFPPLLRAAVALAAIACLMSALRFGTRFHLPTLGLLLLSLPVIPSLQFYAGYPLRVFVGMIAAPLLQMGGFAVIREGTCLNWGGQLVLIDAPCSGVRMLWSGLLLAFVLINLYELRFMKTCLALAVSIAAIIAGNVLRAVALFYIEAGVVQFPAWAHEGIGVSVFLVVAVLMLVCVGQLQEKKSCGVVEVSSL